MNLIKQSQIDLATHAIHTLRVAFIKSDVSTLKKTLLYAEDAVSSVRGASAYSTTVQSLVQNFDRLAVEAGKRVLELSAAANYKGPYRSKMTSGEKVKFITENGQEKFLQLPN